MRKPNVNTTYFKKIEASYGVLFKIKPGNCGGDEEHSMKEDKKYC